MSATESYDPLTNTSGPSVGALVEEWRQLAREAHAAANFDRARALSEDANALQARLDGARTRIQQRHYNLTGQWGEKRVLVAAVDAELASRASSENGGTE